MFNVQVNYSRAILRLDKLPGEVRDHLLTVTKALAVAVQIDALSRAPVKSGRYRETIYERVSSSATRVTAKVGSKSPLAHIIEGGAHIPAHDILPKVAKALHFSGSAGEVFAAAVHSPGGTIKPKHVIHYAFEDMKQNIRDALVSAGREAARGV